MRLWPLTFFCWCGCRRRSCSPPVCTLIDPAPEKRDFCLSEARNVQRHQFAFDFTGNQVDQFALGALSGQDNGSRISTNKSCLSLVQSKSTQLQVGSVATMALST